MSERLSASPTKRISVWSGPRNVSTALLYSFRQRSDTAVVDEPLYGHYLAVTDAPHPGKDEVLQHMETDGGRVVRETLLGTYSAPVVMFKNMAHHLVGLNRVGLERVDSNRVDLNRADSDRAGSDYAFLAELTNVLLVRDPAEMLPSLAHQLPEPTLRDTGLQEQHELLGTVLAFGQTPIVIDAQRLLQNPEATLRAVCERLALPFEPAMLAWPVGPKPEDGVWAKHWYENVWASSTFAPYTPKTAPFPERLEPLLKVCTPLYEQLQQYAL